MSDPAGGDVISLASRRRVVVVAPPARAPARPAARPLGRPIYALGLGVCLLILALAAGTRSRSLADIRALSAGARARIFARALEDMKTTCADVAQIEGALRDHCRSQAEFLRLFPECDSGCQSVAAAALPHARR